MLSLASVVARRLLLIGTAGTTAPPFGPPVPRFSR